MTPDEAIETLRAWLPPMGCTSLPEDPIKPREANTLHSATNTLAALARDHAALLDWAERAAEALENPWETAWGVDEAEPERGEQPTIRQKDVSALLAEWAEMQERPS